MRKKSAAKLLCLTLCSLSFVFVGISCGEKSNNSDSHESASSESGTVTQKEHIELTYDDARGIVSWANVEGATRYVVVVNLRHQNEIYAFYETSESSQKLSLKQGISLITVVAYNGETEVGNGAMTVESVLDFEHPGTPTDIHYNQEDGVLSWNAAEKAAKYKITVIGITDTDFTLEKETTQNSEKLSLPGGVYKISVVAVNDQGSVGAAAEIEYTTYNAAEFDTDEDNDGVIDLFRFNDINVTDILYSGEYAEWASALKSTATAKIVDRTTLETFTAESTDGALAIMAPTQDNGAMSGITIYLPKSLSIGVLSFDLNRQTGATTGVMLSDGKGHTAYYGGLGDRVAWQSWETMSIDISKFLENNPDLDGVREIGIYLRSTKGGAHYIDNLRYEKLGNVGEVVYDMENKTLTWDKVYGATEYIVKQGETELYCGQETSVVLLEGLDKENAVSCTLTLEAKGAGSSKSKEYTLNFFGEIGSLSMNKDTLLVSWDPVAGATAYTLYLNDEKVYSGTDTQYQVSQSDEIKRDWVARLVVYRGEEKKEKTSFVLCQHGNNQLFGERVADKENEYYIAEWHNTAAWGQFSSSGYLGGPEGGVTFTTGSWKVYTGGDMHTRIKEGYLHVFSIGGWGDGRLIFHLPQALDVSELGSISFKVKFVATEGNSWTNDGKARFYFNGTSVYIDGSKEANATITQDGEWSIYTISADVLLENGVTSIADFSVSSNNGYEMDIQEVTYTK